jgi:hypothetical protein
LISSDKGQVDVGAGGAAELTLGLLSRFSQALHSELILAQVDALLLQC